MRNLQARFRTMRHHLESRIGARVDNHNAVIKRHIVRTTDILSKYAVRDNGRTSYEMSTLHTVKHRVIGFAEKVCFQCKIQSDKRNACTNEKRGVGWFVGIANKNTEYLIATKDGTISCSTVRRLLENEACDKKCIQEVDTKYTDYMSTGFRKATIAVRFTQPANAVAPGTHPIPTTFVPRAAHLKL